MADRERLNDPETYARMAVPYATLEDAAAALRRFADGVEILREECRVPDVMCITVAYAEGGKPSAFMLVKGASHMWPTMAATLFAEHAGPTLKRADDLRELALGKRPAAEEERDG